MKWILTISICFAIIQLMTGCNQSSVPAPVPSASPPATADSKEHEHAHGAGPHGGTVTDWGGGTYHVEFTVDHDKKEAAVYILGSDEKTPEPVKAEMVLVSINDPLFQLELKAQPLAGETAGTSSRFVGQHENLGKVQEFAGTITAEVEGTPYAGDFKEEPHGAEHKH